MDPVTQGILGAGIACAVSNKNNVKVAAICGLVGGLVPDLDILIQSEKDSLLSVEYHRHFTHSLFFVPIISLLATFSLFPFLKKYTKLKNIYIYSFVGVLSHGLLDACTSYGTSLVWPLSNIRVSWNIISIIDPIFTFIIIIFLFLCILKKSIKIIRIGLTLSFSYLLLCIFQYQQVKSFVLKNAKNRGHEIERILLNPTIGNNILWRTVYQFNGNYYVDAVYKPIFSKSKLINGNKIEVINKETIYPELGKNSKQRQDIRRFSYFSQDYIFLHPDIDNVIADLRYGKLPYDYNSLWGIEIDTKNKNQHAKFISLRNFKNQDYEDFWNLLKGKITNENKKISNVKTFSGPMGMGLAKSYLKDKEKVCVYNTVNGQDKLIFDDVKIKCPENFEKID